MNLSHISRSNTTRMRSSLNYYILCAIFLCLNFNFSCAYRDSLDASIINDFFQLKNIQHGVIFDCGTPYYTVNLLKKLSRVNNLRVDVQNINSTHFQNETEVDNVFQQLLSTTKWFNSGIILYDDCKNTMTIVKVASTLEVFDETHKWLIIGNDFDEIKRMLDGAELRFDSQVQFALRGKSTKDPWFAYDAYNPGKQFGGKNNITFYGFWRFSLLTLKINTQNDSTLPMETTLKTYTETNYNWWIRPVTNKMHLRSDIGGLTISSIITTEYKPPKGGYIRYLSTTTNTHLDSMHRYSYRLFVLMTEMFNFRMKLIRTNNWGIIKNGTWSGLLGALINREAEISITPSQFKSWRFEIFDQTAVCWLGKASIIFKHPKGSGLRDSFVTPLTSGVWWSTFAILIGTIIILKLMLRQEAKALNQEEDENADEAQNDNSWSYVILVAITGGFCQQGFPHTPYMPSSRWMTLLVILFTFMLYQFYSASIVASLLMEPPRTITDIKTLMKSKLKILIEDVSYNYDFFQESTDPLIKNIYQNVFIPKGLKNVFVSPKIGFKKVEEGGYAFSADVSLAYKIIRDMFDERSICDLCEISLFPLKPIMPLLRKHSPYRQILTYGLRKMEESGVMKYHRSIWHAKQPECSLGGASEPVSVTIDETATAFVILALSCILSILILALEIKIFRRKAAIPHKIDLTPL